MHEAVLVLFATVVGVVLCARLGLPAVLAYLGVGVALGPSGIGLVHGTELTDLLGEIGIAFLLFTIGLEFSFQRLWTMRATLFGLGSLQVLVGTVTGALLTHALGLSWPGAVVAGGALALSSTAIVLKQLSEQGELDAPHGRLAVSILLFQDLAAVPFLVAIPIMGEASMDTLALALVLALGKGVAVIGLMLLIGSRVLPAMFQEVTRHRSPELMTLTVLLVAMAAATISHAVGLSLALGTFAAGMLLAESTYARQIRHDIRPFRDVLLGLFFISVGLALDVSVAIAYAPWVLTLTVGVVAGKGLLIALLTRLARRPWPVALQTGAVLGQGGEFGLALLVLATESGVIDAPRAAVVIAAITLSMLGAPSLVRSAHRIAPPEPMTGDALPTHGEIPKGAVIVAGFGRTGHGLAEVLDELNLPFVAIDNNGPLVRRSVAAIAPELQPSQVVMFGNATEPRVLRSAGIEQAAAMVVTFDDPRHTKEILGVARELNPELPIVVRAPDQASLEMLRQAGAVDGVPETLESSLMLSMQLLTVVGLPFADADAAVRAVRSGRYSLMDQAQNPERAASSAMNGGAPPEP